MWIIFLLLLAATVKIVIVTELDLIEAEQIWEKYR